MPSRTILTFIALALLLTAARPAQAPMPRLTSVEPASGKAGDVLAANGENLQKPNVVELFLTDGKNDQKMVIVEQTPTAIKFRVPTNTKPGRFALMILTGGKEPKLLEQPVKVDIE